MITKLQSGRKALINEQDNELLPLNILLSFPSKFEPSLQLLSFHVSPSLRISPSLLFRWQNNQPHAASNVVTKQLNLTSSIHYHHWILITVTTACTEWSWSLYWTLNEVAVYSPLQSGWPHQRFWRSLDFIKASFFYWPHKHQHYAMEIEHEFDQA